MGWHRYPLAPKDFETCAKFLMGEKIAPSGHVWVFPKGRNSANVGIGILGIRTGKNRALGPPQVA